MVDQVEIHPSNISSYGEAEGSQYIDKAAQQSDPFGYDALTQQALEYVQTLSGEIWTDYNRHDPGITLMEQYCYGLTDLVYRADQPVANIFADSHGNTDYKAHGLFAPSEIFPSAAVTDADFQKLFLDQLPEIEQIRFKPISNAAATQYTGLYDVQVNLTRQASLEGLDNDHYHISEKIRHLFCAHRQLCEDIDSIHYIEELGCEIHARIEISESAIASDLLADLYHQCSKIISPRVKFSDYQQKIVEGMPLDKVFEGPSIYHGYITDEGLGQSVQTVEITALTQMIQRMDGVRSVDEIYLEVDGKKYYESYQLVDDQKALFLKIPTEPKLIDIELMRNGKRVALLIENFKHRVKSLHDGDGQPSGGAYQYHNLVKRPQAEGSDAQGYHSIQHQFPNSYGLSEIGEGESSQRARDQIRQFKTYLMFFDQIIANGMDHVELSRVLLSVQNDLQSELGARFLDETIVADVGMIYRYSEGMSEKKIQKLTRYYEQNLKKRHQAIDFLLAANGEEYDEDCLRRFNYFYSAQEVEYELLRQKQRLLNNVIRLNRDRGLGFNYLKQGLNTTNTSGLQFQVSHRLALKYLESRSLTLNFVRLGLKLVSDRRYRNAYLDGIEPRFVQLDDIQDFKKLDFQMVGREDALQSARKLHELLPLVKDLVPFRHNQLSEKIFRDGYELACYRMGSLTNGADFQLAFQPVDESPPYYLGSFSSIKAAGIAANALQKIILWLNRDSEGLHIVEHSLLRRRKGITNELELAFGASDDFFHQQFSVILPNWSVRFSDDEFRDYSAECIIRHCSAHVLPSIYWVGYEVMFHFEVLYREWTKLLSDQGRDDNEFAIACRGMTEFLYQLKISDGLSRLLQCLGDA